MKKLAILVIAILFTEQICAQEESQESVYPEINKPCPQFVLDNIQYYSKKQMLLKDFKGKWLIIDCWNRFCADCVASFPKTDSLQKKFYDKVQFLLVGFSGSYPYEPWRGSGDSLIRVVFEKYRAKLNLGLAVAYDSTLFHRFDISACPFIIIVDPNGILRGLTYKLTEENIKDFLGGKSPKLPRVTTFGEWLEKNRIEESMENDDINDKNK